MDCTTICYMILPLVHMAVINPLRPRQHGCHFPGDIFRCIFLNENAWIPIKISLKLVPKGPINNIPAMVQIMAWRRPGDKPLSEPMVVSWLMHICVTWPQWVKSPRYTRGDSMFLYRFVRHHRPQTRVHAITSEQLFRFLSYLVGWMTLTCRLPN